MKPTNAKPADGMQYFTPDLYLRFNSLDDEVADQAQQDWDAAIVAYQEHLKRFRPQLPAQIRELSERSFHDASFLKFELDSPGNRLPTIAFLALQDQRQVTALVYILADTPAQSLVAVDWKFSPQPVLWLYDEIDTRAEGGFVHRILLSDGRVLALPFHNAFLHDMTELQPVYRQTA